MNRIPFRDMIYPEVGYREGDLLRDTLARCERVAARWESLNRAHGDPAASPLLTGRERALVVALVLATADAP